MRVTDRSFSLRHVDLGAVLEATEAAASAAEVRADVAPLLERLDGQRRLGDAIALTRLDEFVPLSVGELSDKITSEGFDFVNTYLDGTGGLKSLFNTWARATTEADKLAIAGSINVLTFNNVAESIVHSGAKINQDPFYRPDPLFYTDPDNYDPANNDNNQKPGAGGHSSNANNVDEHVVSISTPTFAAFVTVVVPVAPPDSLFALPQPARLAITASSAIKTNHARILLLPHGIVLLPGSVSH